MEAAMLTACMERLPTNLLQHALADPGSADQAKHGNEAGPQQGH
jgi:hypothetical protein